MTAASTNHFFDISAKVQHNQLFEEVRNSLACIKKIHEKEKEETIINEEERKSSTFSSKSSLLEKMVNKFSSKEIDSQDISLKCISQEKQGEQVTQSISRIKTIPEKLGLKERVNVLLEKNDNSQIRNSNFSSIIDNLKNKFIKITNENTDIINTYDGKATIDYPNNTEQNCENFVNQSENQRMQILETFYQSKAKRCISNDSWLISTFDDVDLVYNMLPANNSTKSFNCIQRSKSCEMFNGLFRNLQTLPSNQEQAKSEKRSHNANYEVFMPKPIWISGKTVDTFRFLIQWLVVSLSDIPLVILELQPSSHDAGKTNKTDEANKNAIAKICIEADKKGWTTGDLMAIISREYFQNTNESVEDCARRALYLHS